MLWEKETYHQQQLCLEGLEDSHVHQENRRRRGRTACLEGGLERSQMTEYQWRTRTPELKARMKERMSRQYQKHKSKRVEYGRKWVERNREKRIQIQKKYRETHKDTCRESARKAYEKSRHVYQSQEWKDRHNAYVALKRRTDPQFLISHRLRATMHQAIRRQFGKKAFKTKQLLGCTVAELKEHLERQFVNGMNWSDRRSFVIDHYVPCRAFDLTKLEEQRWCFNWRNLRPMAHHDNQVKSDTIPNPLPAWLPVEIQRRIKERVI